MRSRCWACGRWWGATPPSPPYTLCWEASGGCRNVRSTSRATYAARERGSGGAVTRHDLHEIGRGARRLEAFGDQAAVKLARPERVLRNFDDCYEQRWVAGGGRQKRGRRAVAAVASNVVWQDVGSKPRGCY